MSIISGLYKTLRIKSIRTELKDFKIFVFDESESIIYKPGQYITLVHSPGENEIRRSYSMTSTPGLNEPLSVGIKRVPNGFYSRLVIDHAEVGDELVTSGVGGLFTLPKDAEKFRQLFFLAAGSGITPIYSLIKSVLHFYAAEVILIYSNHSPSEVIFLNELQLLVEKFIDRFKIVWLFSNSPELEAARLHRDSLMQLVRKFARGSLNEILFYICGPLSYMRMSTFVLQEMGVSPDNIKKENFLIAQPKPFNSPPPDSGSHLARIHFQSKSFNIEVQYPDSILLAAKKQGISLPYSCETGRCGNCLARCVKGTVWLSHNEVLTDKEILSGLTLTCVGHPLGGDVELLIT